MKRLIVFLIVCFMLVNSFYSGLSLANGNQPPNTSPLTVLSIAIGVQLMKQTEKGMKMGNHVRTETSHLRENVGTRIEYVAIKDEVVLKVGSRLSKPRFLKKKKDA